MESFNLNDFEKRRRYINENYIFKNSNFWKNDFKIILEKLNSFTLIDKNYENNKYNQKSKFIN